MATHPRVFLAFFAILPLVASGCVDDDRSAYPTDPEIHSPRLSVPESSAIPARPELPDMTRELRVDLTDHPSGPDDNEEEFLAGSSLIWMGSGWRS